MSYVPLRKAVLATGLHPNTLRKYADNGTIPCIRMPNGARHFDISSFLSGETITILYARVSSHRQKDDLARQVEYLKSKYHDAEIVSDIGSGLNFKRKGLLALLDRAARGAKLRVVVAHRDRLARFGFELIDHQIRRAGGEIVVLGKRDHAGPYDELVGDLLAILTVFGARMHGLRKYRDEIAADQTLADAGAGQDVPALDGR